MKVTNTFHGALVAFAERREINMKVFAFRNEKRVEEKSSSGGAFMAVIDAAFKLCKTGGAVNQ